MKLTKFFAVSLAAFSLFSCTKEMTEAPEAKLNPGEARVEFNLGKGITTYADAAAESAIMDTKYALYQGEALVPITKKTTTNQSSISFTIAADIVKIGGDVTLVVLANTGTGFTLKSGDATVTEMPATLAAAKALTIEGALTDNTAALTKGIPSAKVITFTLKEGDITISDDAKKLDRAASRIYVKNDGRTDSYTSLTGFTIKYTGAASANLVVGGLIEGVAKSAELTYAVDGTATASQAIGYVYPSPVGQKATFTITSPDATPVIRTISFTTEANKNYAINIKPKVTAEGNVDFTLSVTAWVDETVDQVADFSEIDFLKVNPVPMAIATVYDKAIVDDKTSATVVMLPGQIAKIPIRIPVGYTLERADESGITVNDRTVFVNPTSNTDWTGTVNVRKDNETHATIKFTRAIAAVVNFEEINIFNSFISAGFLTEAVLNSPTEATLTVPVGVQATYKLAIPENHTFSLKSSTSSVAQVPPANDWIVIQDGFPRIQTKLIYDDLEAVFEILDANSRPVATFTMKRPAKEFDFSQDGTFGDPLRVTVGNTLTVPQFKYTSKTKTASEVSVLINQVFDNVGAGRISELSKDFTTVVSISEGTAGWLRVKTVASSGATFHRIDIVPATPAVLCVGKFSYVSKITGKEFGHTIVTRRPTLD